MGRGAQGLSQIVFTNMTALNSLYPGTLDLPQFLKLMPSSSIKSFDRWNSVYARSSVPTMAESDELKVICICLKKMLLRWKSASISLFC